MEYEYSLTAILWRVVGVFFLVFANGFFVAAEFAIVTVRKTRVDQRVAEGVRGARAVRRATRDPEVRKRMLEQGAVPVGNTPEEFAKMLREEVARWAEVVKVSGASAN